MLFDALLESGIVFAGLWVPSAQLLRQLGTLHMALLNDVGRALAHRFELLLSVYGGESGHVRSETRVWGQHEEFTGEECGQEPGQSILVIDRCSLESYSS